MLFVFLQRYSDFILLWLLKGLDFHDFNVHFRINRCKKTCSLLFIAPSYWNDIYGHRIYTISIIFEKAKSNQSPVTNSHQTVTSWRCIKNYHTLNFSTGKFENFANSINAPQFGRLVCVLASLKQVTDNFFKFLVANVA